MLQEKKSWRGEGGGGGGGVAQQSEKGGRQPLLQHTATPRNTSQHTATHCNTLHTRGGNGGVRQSGKGERKLKSKREIDRRGGGGGDTGLRKMMQFKTLYRSGVYKVTHCDTLRDTVTHCNTLQHTATHCNTLQHAATHCNTRQHVGDDALQITASLCGVEGVSASHCRYVYINIYIYTKV